MDAGCLYRMEYSDNIHFMCVSFVFLIYSFSLDLDKYKWTGIRDEEATALADPRVIKNFKTLE